VTRKILYIKWLDAHSRFGWHHQGEHDKPNNAMPCESIGFLMRDEKEGITLVQSLSDAFETCGDAIFIPRDMIVGRPQTLGWSEDFK